MPTNNPVPSQSPADLVFNAQKLDEALNSDADTFTDRLGNVRRTIPALERQFPDAEANMNATAGDRLAVAADRVVTEGARDQAVDAAQVAITQGNEILSATQEAANVDYREASWGALAVKVGTSNNRTAYVTGDSGQHVDPVKPGSQIVANSGQYIWRAVSNAWEWIAALPLSKAVFDYRIRLVQLPDGGFALADTKGNIVWKIGGSGGMVNLEYQQTQARALLGSLVANFYRYDAPLLGAAHGDTKGRIAFKVRQNGKVANKHIEAIEATAVRSLKLARRLRPPSDYEYSRIARMIHILLDGQSLSLGLGVAGALSIYATQPQAYMFQGGLRSRDAVPGTANYNANFYAALVALKEAAQGTGSAPRYGETGCFAAMEMIAQLLRDEDGIDLATLGQNFLWSAPGEGESSIAQLGSDGEYWSRVQNDITQGQARAIAAGLGPYGLGAMLYRQMEKDISLGTSAAVYTAALRDKVVGAARAHAAAVTGTDMPLPCIMYQADSHRFYGKDGAFTSAVLAFIESEANFALSTPLYMTQSIDGRHRDPVGYQRIGAYEGIALKRWLFDGIKPRHLKMLQPIWTPNAVVVPFDVPEGRLSIDTTAVTNPGNWGFTLADNAGVDRPVTSVELLGRDRVIVRYAGSALPVGSQLRLGWGGVDDTNSGPTAGARTNLRDQQGDFINFRGYRMDNWAPICAKTRA